jgi:hypothetical protein
MKYVINSEFKAVMKGEYCEANTAAGEFIVDSENSEPVTGAIIQGIADAHGFTVHGKNKSEKLAQLDADLSSLKIGEVREPTITQRVKSIVDEHVVDGVLKIDEDSLIVILIQSVIGFKNAAKTLRHVLETSGLKVSNKDRLSTATSILEKMEFAPKNWGDVIDAAEKVSQGLNDTSEKQALAAIKKYAKDVGLALPEKPAKEKGVSKGVSGFKAKIVKLLVSKPQTTLSELEEFCVENKKEAAVAKRFAWALSIANQLSK